jgi:hypothetical protein
MLWLHLRLPLLLGEGVVRFATRNRRAAASCKGNSKQQHARHIKIESHVVATLAAVAAAWQRCGCAWQRVAAVLRPPAKATSSSMHGTWGLSHMDVVWTVLHAMLTLLVGEVSCALLHTQMLH